ncbi:MAG TPA: methyltransferase domain-containing protein [Thermoleophilaceae bacterium]|nr:methyltransferase domain-containing protein [Thermoleophilaceae bacterium]
MKPEACPACGAEDAARPGPRVGERRFLRCRGCGSLYLPAADRVHASEIYEQGDYFQNPEFGSGGFHGYKDYLADRVEIKAKFHGTLARIEDLLGPGGARRLVDVGAGPGFLVAAARDRGWDAAGVDVNPWAAAYARDEEGVEVRVGSLEEAGFEEGAYDAVTMMDVLEHVEDPAGLVARASSLLRPGGVLAVLTPDASAPASRLMGRRWPEVQRAGEHLVLLSRRGLEAVAAGAGLRPEGRHSVGKRTSLATLAADASPLHPGASAAAERRLRSSALGARHVHVDPKMKYCAYFRRSDGPAAGAENVLRDLRLLGRAGTLGDWMFSELAAGPLARGARRVAEVGAGIGTFSERILAAGPERLVLLEPEPGCEAELRARLGHDPRVEISADALPDAPALAEGAFDLVVCQNVLEHVEREAEAVAAMARALAPGGTLALLVPAGPRLFGSLDVSYGHHRRYDRERLAAVVAGAGLEVRDLRPFNLLGVPGWWLSNRTGRSGIGAVPLAAYDLGARAWRPLERRLRPRHGLSLICHAEKPA